MASRASSGLLVKQVHHLWSGTWTTVFATFILRTLLLYCVSDELCVCIRASQLIFRPSNMHPLHFVRPSSRRATAAILFFSFLVIFLSACDCSSTIMISSARLPKFETTPNPNQILLWRFWREGWIANVNKTLPTQETICGKRPGAPNPPQL